MKKILLLLMISSSLLFLSSCIKVLNMSDVELVLIDEGFSIIEFQEAQRNGMNLGLSDYCQCQAKRIIEGRMNQITQVYIFEFEKQSHAVDFERIVSNNQFIHVIDFLYSKRYGNIVILAESQTVIKLFENI